MWSYIGLAVGDMTSGLLSQAMRSRKKVVFIFILLTLCCILLFLYSPVTTANGFYVSCFMLGFGIGYWALFVTIAAEQFGTNLRSTVTTTVPNFIRGTVVPLTWAFSFLSLRFGIIQGALFVGLGTIVVALIALRSIEETFSRDMNFLEEDK
ncbi:MAG TPA: MFS transporter, partial [Cyclobacteriaceae bacterium]